jgi:PleD family two-component response regulator
LHTQFAQYVKILILKETSVFLFYMQVAEDNRINQKVLRMMLQANCAELTIVSDGQQAVEAFSKVLHIILCYHKLALSETLTSYRLPLSYS